MLKYAVCWSLVATVTLIGQATENVRLSFKREYGRALYRECQLDVTIFEARGLAALQCTYNVEPARILHAERALAQPEVTQLVALARASDLCTGGHTGTDTRGSDGELETLMTNCSESRVAVLVTSGNPTFRKYNARRKLSTSSRLLRLNSTKPHGRRNEAVTATAA